MRGGQSLAERLGGPSGGQRDWRRLVVLGGGDGEVGESDEAEEARCCAGGVLS